MDTIINISCGSSAVVARLLPKEKVASSNLVSRSIRSADVVLPLQISLKLFLSLVCILFFILFIFFLLSIDLASLDIIKRNIWLSLKEKFCV